MASVITQSVAAVAEKFTVIKFACTAHTDGSFSAVTTNDTINKLIRGKFLYKAQVVISGEPPTASSDFTVKDLFTVDLLGGQGVDAIPASGTSERHPVILYQAATQPIVTSLVLAITGNSVNAAVFDIYLYFEER